MPDQLITSSSPHGCVIAMNMWVHPDKVPKVLDNMRLVLEKLKADPNCLYIDTCQNPQDPAHLRFVHGWKTDSKYFYEVRLSPFLGTVRTIGGDERFQHADADEFGGIDVPDTGLV
jgi:quinol monooxygenase YgiN